LRTETYSTDSSLLPLALNPPAAATGSATFRRWLPEGRDPIVHLYGTLDADQYNAAASTHGDDQLNCALRAVGTFPAQQNGPNVHGVVPEASSVVVREVRQNMQATALGASGFNIPSLVGVAAGAPYFHAGNARSLEEVFDSTFKTHYQALVPEFLADGDAERSAKVRDLVAYLLSIDDDKPVIQSEPGFDLCGQLRQLR
jgi:hypothetical protein